MENNLKAINAAAGEIELDVEVMEEVIAPATMNHNETLEIDLNVEELEEVIAPGVIVNQ
jgi:hypothetical protein